MTSAALQRRARPVIAVAATLFLVDLFLGWQRVAVSMPAIDVRSTASGWGGWGALAGLCALGLLTLAIVGRSSQATVALGLGALVFTALEVLAGHANVDAGASMMRVHVDTTLWPAWVGFALAGVMAVAAAIPYLAVPGERTPTTVAPHGRT
ncbi:MAG: hypothetical protein ACXVVU_25745 [Solirubrobacteraceae bacterium]